VTMETHGRVAEHQFSLCRFRYYCHIYLLFELRLLPSNLGLTVSQTIDL
jgi:hypothetical protein